MPSSHPYRVVAQAFARGQQASNSTGSFRTDGIRIWSYKLLLAHRDQCGNAFPVVDAPIVWDDKRLDEGGRMWSATTNLHKRALESVLNADGSPASLRYYMAEDGEYKGDGVWGPKEVVSVD